MNDMQGLFARFGVSLLCGKANIVPMGLKRSFTGLLASRADIHERPSRLLALNPLPGLGQKPRGEAFLSRLSPYRSASFGQQAQLAGARTSRQPTLLEELAGCVVFDHNPHVFQV